uniref:serine/threonine-protein phosphatase 7 long form homolog n=1 Tax=Erigeron canadensis TaxID=72917 RepID=UPI001CB8BB8A|nr:serine/threonine-protein phosphatase 7 long form homolog [Erigeron canadensis]
MANINVTCIPRNPELLWLQAPQNQHISYNLFTHGVENPLKSRRCDSGLTNHIKSLPNERINENVFQHIRNASFEGVFKAGIHQIDHQLIVALVERWRPETHTFHFPIGEATVTLQDVQVLWGLPIDGPVVSGTWAVMDSDQWIVMCQDYLGFIPEEVEELNQGRIKISTLVEHLKDRLDDDDDAYQQRARIYILAMIAGQLFVDSSQYDVSLNYLESIDDLSIEGRLSWGSAVLACLYRNLCKATLPGTKGIQGPLLLLQLWAWERMPHIAPRIVHGRLPPYQNQHCYAARW